VSYCSAYGGLAPYPLHQSSYDEHEELDGLDYRDFCDVVHRVNPHLQLTLALAQLHIEQSVFSS
jgi:hypothetical protein